MHSLHCSSREVSHKTDNIANPFNSPSESREAPAAATEGAASWPARDLCSGSERSATCRIWLRELSSPFASPLPSRSAACNRLRQTPDRPLASSWRAALSLHCLLPSFASFVLALLAFDLFCVALCVAVCLFSLCANARACSPFSVALERRSLTVAFTVAHSR
jgi:hypothetical protein